LEAQKEEKKKKTQTQKISLSLPQSDFGPPRPFMFLNSGNSTIYTRPLFYPPLPPPFLLFRSGAFQPLSINSTPLFTTISFSFIKISLSSLKEPFPHTHKIWYRTHSIRQALAIHTLAQFKRVCKKLGIKANVNI